MNRLSFQHLLAFGSALLLSALVLVSCKRTYDAPPPAGRPGLAANITIRDLKALSQIPYGVVAISEDLVVRGIVNMDDKSGNYYQQISIQDTTGGIILRLAGSNLNTSYPVGREVFVRLKGLYLGEYGGMIQLGGGADSIDGGVTMLSPVLQDQHIYKGALNQPLVPRVVNVAQLTTTRFEPLANMLIEIQNYEFGNSDTARNYADIGASGNRVARGCGLPSAANITVRTSNYANFATRNLPNGNGTLRGIYSFFGSTKQLTLRDTADVMFYGPRCGTGTGGGPIGSTPTLDLGTTSPYTINFNSLATGLPNGVRVGTTSTGSTNDTAATFVTTATAWSATGLNWKNYASAISLTQGATSVEQDGSPNRALGIRQTSTVGAGGDPGASVSFILANTSGKSNLQMQFSLQSLDPSVTRTTTWTLEYALGNNPTTWTAVTTNPATLPITGTAGSNPTPWGGYTVSAVLPAAVSNQNQLVWIRLVARSATNGSGSRPVTAIDDVRFSWN